MNNGKKMICMIYRYKFSNQDSISKWAEVTNDVNLRLFCSKFKKKVTYWKKGTYKHVYYMNQVHINVTDTYHCDI